MNGEYLDCKILSAVMMSHLNSLNFFLWELNPFVPNLFTVGWDFTDSDYSVKGPSDYLIQSPCKSVQYE